MANVGAAFELDMNYTGKAPPSKFDWFKNGQPFSGDGDRVTTSHTGIIFTRVRPEDTGQYLVRAITRNVGEAEASTTLKGTAGICFTTQKVVLFARNSYALFCLQWLFTALMV